MSNEPKKSEKERICPSCRMAISVLATKCRFCGEEVGKPKEEQRELSINDLGGESIQHRAPSGSVMEALESFRVEDAGADDGMDLGSLGEDLDPEASGFNVSSDVSDVFRHGGGDAKKDGNKESSSERIMTVLKVAAVLGVIIAGALTIPKMIESRRAEARDQLVETYVNPAEGIYRSTGSAVDALKAAVEAVGIVDDAANRKILADMTLLVLAEVNGKLNARPWNFQILSEASSIASQAANHHPTNPDIIALNEQVRQDTLDYRLVYMGPTDDGRAKFKENKPGAQTQVYGEGDLLANRFRITQIIGRRQVKMVDEKRGNRALICELGFGPK